MPDSISTENKKPNWINLTTFILMVLGFFGGLLTNWNTRSSQLDQVMGQMTTLSNDFKTFTKEYNLSHEDTAVAVKGMNQHLEYDDRRLDDLEQKVKFGK
jgi:hypothetical protein